MTLFFTDSADSERQTLHLSKIQGFHLYENTKEAMQQFGEDTAIMWEMNYEISDYFSLDGGGDLSAKQYSNAALIIIDACQSTPELQDIYEPIKSALMADKRFQAA